MNVLEYHQAEKHVGLGVESLALIFVTPTKYLTNFLSWRVEESGSEESSVGKPAAAPKSGTCAACSEETCWKGKVGWRG